MSGLYRTRRGGAEVSEDEVMAQVRSRLFRHGALCAGMYCSPGDSAYYVAPAVFRNILCAGFDPLHVGRLLARRGVLRLVNGYGFQHRATLPDGRVMYVYVIQPEALGVEASHFAEKAGEA